jgi:hypothetical protein
LAGCGNLINLAGGTVNFGTALELNGFVVDASLKAEVSGVSGKWSREFGFGFPSIGFALDNNPQIWSVSSLKRAVFRLEVLAVFSVARLE